ncbi:siderophore-interacting protein [Nocardioides sp. Y6]|uniref:Siderophore-interacting protein n=1 Tax=Nocardioides malaquae TaxID=2773426 RepID=A0ABR9RW50_9ACTN|nr:siderophore-interacting protein [Nocardioides malaquae]MBE7325825.1 siderophore-interacting protein [Nocardioides malaquae]
MSGSAHDDYSRVDPGAKVEAFRATGRGTARIGYPIRLTRTVLATRELVTPSMLRLTLRGPELAHFETHAADDHVKVVFAQPDGTRTDPVPDASGALTWPRPLPPSRKYTVRRFDAAAGELDLDVVLHPGGLASEWAVRAEVGEEVVVAGPPGAKVFAHTYGHYVLVADPTGLPAVARWLEESPADVSADVVLDVDHEHERGYPLAARAGVRVQWFDRADGSRAADVVAGLELPADTFLFAAGEAGDVRPLRRWARERGIDALVTGYWKRGVVEFDE